MEYRFNQRASLASYSPYQILYGRESVLPLAEREKLNHVVDLDDPKIWAQLQQDWAEYF